MNYNLDEVGYFTDDTEQTSLEGISSDESGDSLD